MLRTARLVASIIVSYGVAIGTIGYLILPPASPPPATPSPTTAVRAQPTEPRQQAISGKPVRIVIPSHNIDLPVDDGIYAVDGSWTLSDTRAQFALMSTQPNDQAGNTFIYGHGTEIVFGKLAKQPPTSDTQAHIYTSNGWEFTYIFRDSRDLTPTDTEILKDTASGSPRLTVQTCTGVWSEWRTMFTFVFSQVARSDA